MPNITFNEKDTFVIACPGVAGTEKISIEAVDEVYKTGAKVINLSRKERIAKGSGTSLPEVNALLKQFEQMKKMMKQFSNKKVSRYLNIRARL